MLEVGREREKMAQSLASSAEFRRFFDEYFAEVRSYCLRRLPVADANDAVSEVFLVVWRRRDTAPDDVKPWLFAIARNIVRNQERSSRRALRLRSQVRSEPAYAEPGPEVQVIRNAEDEELVRAVSALPDKYAEVLRLWAWEWLTAPQIADVVGCSVSAAEKRLTRGIKRLRVSLANRNPHAIGREVQQ